MLFRPAPRALLIALFAVLAACQTKKSDEKTTGRTKETDAPTRTEANQPVPPVEVPSPHEQPPPSAPRIEVLEAGQDPKPLRYQFSKGNKKSFSLKMTVEPTITINNNPMPASPPTTFEVTGTSTTVEVLPDGSAKRISSFDSLKPSAVGLPPGAIEQLKAQFGMLAGMKVEEVISARGNVSHFEVIEIPAQNPALAPMIRNLQDGLSNAILPLPEEPIGVGGVWRAATEVTAAGVKVSQTTQFKVISFDNGKLSVEGTFSQSAPPKAMDAAALPPGTSIELLAMKGDGSGKLSVDLRTLDVNSDVTLQMNVETKTIAPGAPGPVLSQTKTKLKVLVALANAK